jgi:hypothetical protein
MTLTCAKDAPGNATTARTTKTAVMRPVFRRPKSAFSLTLHLLNEPQRTLGLAVIVSIIAFSTSRGSWKRRLLRRDRSRELFALQRFQPAHALRSGGSKTEQLLAEVLAQQRRSRVVDIVSRLTLRTIRENYSHKTAVSSIGAPMTGLAKRRLWDAATERETACSSLVLRFRQSGIKASSISEVVADLPAPTILYHGSSERNHAQSAEFCTARRIVSA